MAFPSASNVVATIAGLGQVAIAWTNPPGTAWVDVWRGRKGQSGRGICILAAAAATTSFVDTSAPLGAEVRYLVYAGDGPRSEINWDTNGTWSNFVTTSVLAPGSLTAKRIGSDVVLTWTNPAGAASTGAVVRASTNGGSSWSTLASPSGAGMVTWTHTGASQVSTWVYQVQLQVGGQSSGWSASSNSVGPVAAPFAPSNLDAGPAFDPALASTWSWRHNAADTTDQTAFEIQHRIQGSPSWSTTGKITSSDSSRTWGAGSFVVGQLYEWQVRTWGLHATVSPWSALSTVATSSTPVAGIATTSPYAASTLTVEGSYYHAESSPAAAMRWTLTSDAGAVIETASELIPGSGVVAHTFLTPLVDGLTVFVGLQVQSAAGIWSPLVTTALTAAFVKPPAPTVSAVFGQADASVALTYQTPAGGTAPAVSVEVWRGAVRLAAGLPTVGTIVDRIPPLGQAVQYRVVSVSALPSAAETLITVSTVETTPRIWINAGDGFVLSAAIRRRPKVDFTFGVEQVSVQFAGREYPVTFWGEASRRRSPIAGAVQTVAEIDALERVVAARTVACYRDPDGRRIFVALGDLQYPGGSDVQLVKPISIDARQTDFTEGG